MAKFINIATLTFLIILCQSKMSIQNTENLSGIMRSSEVSSDLPSGTGNFFLCLLCFGMKNKIKRLRQCLARYADTDMKSIPRALPCKRCSQQNAIWLGNLGNLRLAGNFGYSFLSKTSFIIFVTRHL